MRWMSPLMAVWWPGKPSRRARGRGLGLLPVAPLFSAKTRTSSASRPKPSQPMAAPSSAPLPVWKEPLPSGGRKRSVITKSPAERSFRTSLPTAPPLRVTELSSHPPSKSSSAPCAGPAVALQLARSSSHLALYLTASLATVPRGSGSRHAIACFSAHSAQCSSIGVILLAKPTLCAAPAAPT